MKCPFCKKSLTKVLDSRPLEDGRAIRRRRKCIGCSKRMTSYEYVEIHFPSICKKDGRRENYQREKLARGLEKACQKLPIPKDVVQSIMEHIERWLLELGQTEIESQDIGKKVMFYLKGINPVAYVRFASVYKRFEDIDEFYFDLKNPDKIKSRQQIGQPTEH